jgi:hypothetical protein
MCKWYSYNHQISNYQSVLLETIHNEKIVSLILVLETGSCTQNESKVYLRKHLYSRLVWAMSPSLSLIRCPISGLFLLAYLSSGKIVSRYVPYQNANELQYFLYESQSSTHPNEHHSIPGVMKALL